ncbi:hypothetical protein PSHT_01926 [Puccinia striiformis]|uniref:Uncharacterized protein n=1 Tax=Puccinia striiformis TaxID=27350 RepID=A0A2S4WJA1_9BASI|nr:hypothetical protein PSHT_01926 [Puccinia striiformis]
METVGRQDKRKHKVKCNARVMTIDWIKLCITHFRLINPTIPVLTSKAQWQDQRDFQQNHLDTETAERERLAVYLDREATLTKVRRRIDQLAANRANPGTYDSIMEALVKLAEAPEERNAQLLVWHAKSKLYSHSVELHAERQPLYRGTHIGTTLSTRILAAIERCKRPILSSLNKFNGYQNDYLTNFDQQISALEEEVNGNTGIDSDFNMRPPDVFQSITSVDLGECEEIDKLVLVQSVLQEELSKHRSLMQRWAGDVLDLCQTIHWPATPDHPWFSLINSLPPPSIDVTGTKDGDLEIVTILDEEDNGSDIDGEEIKATEMMNLLNIADNY